MLPLLFPKLELYPDIDLGLLKETFLVCVKSDYSGVETAFEKLMALSSGGGDSDNGELSSILGFCSPKRRISFVAASVYYLLLAFRILGLYSLLSLMLMVMASLSSSS